MRKQHKGTTVVEVVIAFAMVSMSFAIGSPSGMCAENGGLGSCDRFISRTSSQGRLSRFV